MTGLAELGKRSGREKARGRRAGPRRMQEAKEGELIVGGCIMAMIFNVGRKSPGGGATAIHARHNSLCSGSAGGLQRARSSGGSWLTNSVWK